MTTIELKEYLEIVVDMEKNIFMQESLVSTIDREMELLSQPTTVVNPTPPPQPEKNRTLCLVA